MQYAASAITAPDTDQLSVYWQFHEAVTRAQLTEWLPTGRHLLVDVSGPRAPAAELAAKAGHTVLRVVDPGPGRAGGAGRAGSPKIRGGGGIAPRGKHPRIIPVIADSSRLTFLGDGCADGVIADDRALSVHLAAEAMIAEIARVLRPAGRVIACVDSLVLGMAVLADQHHWAHLVDLPHAEVVLVPWPDGMITRCYGPDQARELFTGAGLRVNWIRPRTVFSRVGGDALAAARPERAAQAGASRARGPARRVARRAAGDLGQQAPSGGFEGADSPPKIGGSGGSPPAASRVISSVWPTCPGSRRSGRRRGGRRACPRGSRDRSRRTARSCSRRSGTARRGPRHAGCGRSGGPPRCGRPRTRMDPASAESCGYPVPATGPGPSPCRTAIVRSRSSRISSRRFRATVVSTGVLAFRPRAVAAQARIDAEPRLRAADSEQLAGRPLFNGGILG